VNRAVYLPLRRAPGKEGKKAQRESVYPQITPITADSTGLYWRINVLQGVTGKSACGNTSFRVRRIRENLCGRCTMQVFNNLR
jgi:hypothetical protein